MSENLKKCLPILAFIAEIKDQKLKISLLKYYAKYPKFYLALNEICKNLIKGNVKLSKYKRSKLLKVKSNIYKIANCKKLNRKEREKQIVQTGGWSWIIPIITGLLQTI